MTEKTNQIQELSRGYNESIQKLRYEKDQLSDLIDTAHSERLSLQKELKEATNYMTSLE